MEKKKKINGFTLIELLAVIIILGVLMLVAIPSVTSYINNSRKESYITTAKNIIKGATNKVNSGELDMYDPETTYYIPSTCIPLETGGESPFGKFDPAYVLVTYDNDTYNYYWISRDTAGQGISKVTSSYDLNAKLIEAGITKDKIEVKYAVGGRNNLMLLDAECATFEAQAVSSTDIVSIPDGGNGGAAASGLTYNGQSIVVTPMGDIKTKLETKCTGGTVSDLGVTFEATYANYANVKLNNYFSSQADVGIKTNVSIETDAETGDSRVVVGTCTVDSTKLSNLDLSKFSNNGESVTRAYLEEMANNRCSELNEMLESLDTECVRYLINH